MPPVPPTLHFPSPYAVPQTLPTFAEYVGTPDGARIAAFVYGKLGSVNTNRPPVLMLHGNGGNHTSFGPIIDAVVATGRPVVALDSRAQGKSTRGKAPLTYELMAQDAVTALDALGVAVVHVLGYSDGGIEGLLLARDYGERVASLTILGANLTPEGVIDDDDWDIAGQVAANKAWQAYWTTTLAPGVEPALLTPTPTEAGLTAELLQLMLDEPHIPAESLSAIHCPTTVMVGEFDCITPEETAAIHHAIAGSELVVIPEAGHGLPKLVPGVVTLELQATIERAETN